MTPRLRTMVADGERTILVLDRLGVPVTEARQVDHLDAIAKRMGFAGLMVLAFEVELPDDSQTEGLAVHTDEVTALRWALQALETVPVGGNPGELNPASGPARHLDTLRLLYGRARQQL